MEKEKPYQPTPEELKNAEETMTNEQYKLSAVRAERINPRNVKGKMTDEQQKQAGLPSPLMDIWIRDDGSVASRVGERVKTLSLSGALDCLSRNEQAIRSEIDKLEEKIFGIGQTKKEIERLWKLSGK